jgi:ligand-binding sensor domain-containing protein
MNIQRLFAIAALLGLLSQPLPAAQSSAQPTTVGASATQEAWRNFTKITYFSALALQGDYLWAGTDGGVVRWDTRDGSYTKFTTADGLAGNYIDAVASHPTGNMWFATGSIEGYGLSKFDGTHWKTYTVADGLAGNRILSITSDPAGNMWFGSSSGGVSKYDGKIMTTYSTANGLPDNYVAAIASDKAGNIWVGTSNGLSKFDGSHWTMVSSFVQ